MENPNNNRRKRGRKRSNNRDRRPNNNGNWLTRNFTNTTAPRGYTASSTSLPNDPAIVQASGPKDPAIMKVGPPKNLAGVFNLDHSRGRGGVNRSGRTGRRNPAPIPVNADMPPDPNESPEPPPRRERSRRNNGWKNVGGRDRRDRDGDRDTRENHHTDRGYQHFGGMRRGKYGRKNKFDDHMDKEDAAMGLKNGELFEGHLRINGKNPKHAYVSCDGVKQDVFIGDSVHRNRAQNGDRVVVQLLPVDEWRTVVNSDTLDLEHAVEALMMGKESEDETDNESCQDVSDPLEEFGEEEEVAAQKSTKAIIVSIFSVKPWGYGRAVKFEDCIHRIQNQFKSGPIKSYIHSLALTTHNLNKYLVDDHCDVVLIICPFSRNAQFTLEEENGNCLNLFEAILKKCPKLPSLLILDCPQADSVEKIARSAGIPHVVTITTVAHNSNDDARNFLERFIPSVLSPDFTVRDAYHRAMRDSECSGIRLYSSQDSRVFHNHPVDTSIDVADTRDVDVGLLPTQIDCRQWGRDDDIYSILEKLKHTCHCRALFVHSIVSGMGLHSVLLVVAREAARLNRFPKGIYIVNDESLCIDNVEKVLENFALKPDEAAKDVKEKSVLLVFPCAQHVPDEFIVSFEQLLKKNTHVWALIGIRGKTRQDLETNDAFDRTLFDYHELAPLDPGFAGIILWEQYQGSKNAGDFDLTEWRESPLWKCVPTLPDVIVQCAKLMQAMELNHVDMATALTLYEHSSSEWNDLMDPPCSTVAEVSQAVIDFLKKKYNLSIDMNSVREWASILPEDVIEQLNQDKNWKHVSDTFLKDSIRQMYDLSPQNIEKLIHFRVLCNGLRNNLPEPKYTPGSGRDPIPAPQMNETLLQSTLDLSALEGTSQSKNKSQKPKKAPDRVQISNNYYPEPPEVVELEMPDPPEHGYQKNLSHLQDFPTLNGPLVQLPTPIMRPIQVWSEQKKLQPLMRGPPEDCTYPIPDLLRMRKNFTDFPSLLSQADPLIKKKRVDHRFTKLWTSLEHSIFQQEDYKTLIRQVEHLLDGKPRIVYQDQTHKHQKRPQYCCNISVSVDGQTITRQAKSNSRNASINGAMQKMSSFFKEMLASQAHQHDQPYDIEYPDDDPIADLPPHPNSYPDLQPVGKVVCIMEKTDHNIHVGYIKPFRKNGEVQSRDRWVRFVPLDPRVSRAFFPKRDCFPEFIKDPSANHRNRYLRVKYLDWEVTQQLPGCKLIEEVGMAGNLDVETEAILSMSKVRQRETFPEAVDAHVREKYGDWTIPPEEYKRRKDCRDMRIFSIDPPTARDLDDALSLEELPNGNYRIGVHIADVTYFVRPGDPVDKEARKRCTSVYLVHKVIPMLPRLLCENLCSLNPGVERLASSVFFEMTPEGMVVEDGDVWYGRTIIKSCAKLDYGVALGAIREEVNEEKDVDPRYLPTGGHTLKDCILDIRTLWKIAKARRAWRFDTGSLTLDKVKLTFRLNEDLTPVNWLPYSCAESNWLIEEFMLLANTLVAKQLLKKIPDKAFLRRHPCPNMRSARRMLAICKAKNIMIDMSTAGKLQQSLDKLPPKQRRLVETLLTKPMLSAEYICAGCFEYPDEWRHFALNFDHYTHFTSPIRRYADVMVHRMLWHTLPSEKFIFDEKKEMVKYVADNCNEMKMNSKAAQDRSSILFLCLYVDKNPINVTATVVDIGAKSFTVCIDSMGIEHRVSCSQIKNKKSCVVEGKMPNSKIKITWKTGEEEEFAIFEDIEVQLTAKLQTPMELLALPLSPKAKKKIAAQKAKAKPAESPAGDAALQFDFD